jgi:hypothetical protein
MSIIKEDSAILLAYKKMFGLSNVDNTLDNDKVLNNAEIEELKNKLDLIGGTLIGNLFGTNATFTNDLTSNISKTGITMVQLLELIQELKTQISASPISLSNITITLNSDFPVKIPFSSSTIDQIIEYYGVAKRNKYYLFTDSFRPFGMTCTSSRAGIAWSINKNTVHRDVWKNPWTVVTRVWYTEIPGGITIKFGEKWDRWNTGLGGNGNSGSGSTDPPDSGIASENIYFKLDYPDGDYMTLYDDFAMTNIESNKLVQLKPYWRMSPDVGGGVYIIISYDTTAITIKFCTSDGTKYYNAKTKLNPLTNDRKPFQIYSNLGLHIWYYGIVLSNTLNNNPIDDINMFKNQFSSIY